MTAAFSAISFVAGVAGDLSASPEQPGAPVLVRIPPKLPLGTVRAAPLPALPRTSTAQAAPAHAARALAAPAAPAAELAEPAPVRISAPAPILAYEFEHELGHGWDF